MIETLPDAQRGTSRADGPGPGSPASVESDGDRGRPVLEFRGVSKSFGGPEGSVQALAGISITAHAGEFLTILGPSGCGKSSACDRLCDAERQPLSLAHVGAERRR